MHAKGAYKIWREADRFILGRLDLRAEEPGTDYSTDRQETRACGQDQTRADCAGARLAGYAPSTAPPWWWTKRSTSMTARGRPASEATLPLVDELPHESEAMSEAAV